MDLEFQIGPSPIFCTCLLDSFVPDSVCLFLVRFDHVYHPVYSARCSLYYLPEADHCFLTGPIILFLCCAALEVSLYSWFVCKSRKRTIRSDSIQHDQNDTTTEFSLTDKIDLNPVCAVSAQSTAQTTARASQRRQFISDGTSEVSCPAIHAQTARRGLEKPTELGYRRIVTKYKRQLDKGLLTKEQFRALKRQAGVAHQEAVQLYNIQAWSHQLKVGLITKRKYDLLVRGSYESGASFEQWLNGDSDEDAEDWLSDDGSMTATVNKKEWMSPKPGHSGVMQV